MEFDFSLIPASAAATLKNALASDSFPQAALLSDGSDALRRAAAFHIAKTLLCSGRAPGSSAPCGECPHCRKIGDGESSGHPDLVVIDGSDRGDPEAKEDEKKKVRNISVATVREELIAQAWLTPHEAARKVFIVDNAELLGVVGQNALLKITEEAPDDVYFIFTVYDRHALIETILSRFTSFRLGDGSAPHLLTDGKAAGELAEALARAAADGGEYRMMLATAAFGSTDRETLHDALVLFTGELTAALKEKYAPGSGSLTAMEISAAYPGAKLAQLADFTGRLAASVYGANTNLKLAGAMLSSRFDQ